MLGECLERMAELPDESVDMILCDLPYGTTACAWDQIIPFEPLWREYWRISKPNAAVVLTASQPFTSALIMSQVKAFKYCWVWDKVVGRGHLVSKKRPMANHEDICVFYKKAPTYNPFMTEKKKPESGNAVETSRTAIVSGVTTREQSKVVRTHSYPKTIQRFASESNSKKFHPTQKPVALFEYLIRTYTDEGMTVLDNCAGSGTTAIAAERAGRNWICIERDPEYYAKACERIEAEVASKGLFS